MTKENSFEKALIAFNFSSEVGGSLIDSSISFRSRNLIADVLYPQKIKCKRKPKPSSPRFTPLPNFEKKSYKK